VNKAVVTAWCNAMSQCGHSLVVTVLCCHLHVTMLAIRSLWCLLLYNERRCLLPAVANDNENKSRRKVSWQGVGAFSPSVLFPIPSVPFLSSPWPRPSNHLPAWLWWNVVDSSSSRSRSLYAKRIMRIIFRQIFKRYKSLCHFITLFKRVENYIIVAVMTSRAEQW